MDRRLDVARLFREYVQLDRALAERGSLTPGEEARHRQLKAALSDKFGATVPPERDTRQSLRVPTRLEVAFPSDGALARSLMTNLSRTGVFVKTDHPREVGERFELQILVEAPRREIVAPVEVISVGLGPNLLPDRRGMGLRFLDTDPDVQKQIDQLYALAVR